MNLKNIYKKFPTHKSAISLIESLKWKSGPTCPYCLSQQYSYLKNEDRYHCNVCNASFTVTVDTIFKRTRCDLQKWFLAIHLLEINPTISSRKLADEIGTTKDSAWLIMQKISIGKKENLDFIEALSKNISS
jgi:transposase-like protein